ncbi:MAG: AAA family ATPase [Roseburia sp.]|nr:AAA family ATPase [Roseburia sp.]
MYYSEKNLVVDDLLYLVNSNGKMTSPKKISENNRIMQPRKLAEEQLDRLIGLDNVKESIYRRTAFYKVQSIAQQRGKKVNITTNMIFVGHPGTAKTTVARIYARYLYEMNLSKQFKFVECTRSDLVERWAGHTAKKTKEMVEKALGGVLFIDEAYSLVEDTRGGYGDEVINTLVSEIENHRGELTVILAGYPEEMEVFLNSNPGLRSRFSCVLHFEDYSIQELCDISHYVAVKNGYIMGEGVDEVLSDIFTKVINKENFGNGRYARNIVEEAMISSAYKNYKLEKGDEFLLENMSDDLLFTLQPEDFTAVESDK